MISPAQLRAARALIGWRQEDLAAKAGMAVGTINSAEAGSKATRPLTLKVLVDILVAEGVEFIPEDGEFEAGVRLRENASAATRTSADGKSPNSASLDGASNGRSEV